MEARRSAGLNSAPPCSWSRTPPQELKEAAPESLSANAGYVSFGNPITSSRTNFPLSLAAFNL